MNPLRLFDYVFYSIASLFDKGFGYTLSRVENGVTGLSFLQTLNFFTLFFIMGFKDLFKENYGVIQFFAVMILLFGLNLYRYKRIILFSDLSKQWDSAPDKTSTIRTLLVIIYIISSIVGLILSSELTNTSRLTNF